MYNSYVNMYNERYGLNLEPFLKKGGVISDNFKHNVELHKTNVDFASRVIKQMNSDSTRILLKLLS